jgi:hypothetical protein
MASGVQIYSQKGRKCPKTGLPEPLPMVFFLFGFRGVKFII